MVHRNLPSPHLEAEIVQKWGGSAQTGWSELPHLLGKLQLSAPAQRKREGKQRQIKTN